MLRILSNPSSKTIVRLINRKVSDLSDVEVFAASVYQRIAKCGDKAVIDLTNNIDGVNINNFVLTRDDLLLLAKSADPIVKRAIKQAKQNITLVHSRQYEPEKRTFPVAGATCWRETRPIQTIGVYIPGGTAPLISTALMLLVPAKLAGCKDIVVCTPPNNQGSIDANMAFALIICGVKSVNLIGGAQAIAAMALGTKLVPKVDKIFGPGNKYVTASKELAIKYGCAIDMPAGPSEVLVMVDQYADPSFVAADLLSQAEHDPDSQVILVTNNIKTAEDVNAQINKQLHNLPRKDIASKALSNSYAFVFNDNARAIKFINGYAPEHLILNVENAGRLTNQIYNAGSVFVGPYSPESAGDYASGTNHTLPTNGWAKSYSGLGVESFQKRIYFQAITKSGLENIKLTVTALAEAEGLYGHAEAVRVRFKGEKDA